MGDVSPPIRPLMVHHAPVRIDRSWARIRDVDLYVVSLGAQKGIPLVVIHGGPDWDHSYLLRPINQLATARRIVLFDIRGCGRSTRGLPSRAYQPVEVAKDLDV